MKRCAELNKLSVWILILVFTACTSPTAYAAWQFFNDEEEISQEPTPEQKKIVKLFKVLELSRIKMAKSLIKPVGPPAKIYKPFVARLITIDLVKQVTEPPFQLIQPYKNPRQITEIKIA